MHWANQARQEFYNGVKYSEVTEGRTDLSLGIQCAYLSFLAGPCNAPYLIYAIAAISQRGGIVGRGVLLDFVRYAQRLKIEYNPLSNYPISLTQIKEMVQEEGLTIRQGDILIIRSGLSKWIRASTPVSKGPWESKDQIGVDPTPELLEWIWDNNIAAVAGDSIAFEACPASDGSRESMGLVLKSGSSMLIILTGMRLHEACLPGWGMPIGEMFDLEALASVAEKNNRWSFFLTFCPLNIEGGAASVANTLAVF